jgi:transposase
MADKDIITMSQRELKRLELIRRALDRVIKQREAAGILGLSERQIRRLVKRVRKEGAEGIIHKSRGKPSHRMVPKRVKSKVLKLCEGIYKGFNPTFAAEKLSERDGITISRETIRGWFIAEEIEYDKRKGRPHRQWRERKHYFGEMIQVDGSHHDWFEGRGPACVLMGYIDDARGQVYARFYEYEGTIPAMDSFKRYSEKYGLPVSIYLDCHSTYKAQAEPTIEEQLEGKVPATQFGRALKELGVEIIYALSPQAKGRIERLFRTFQDRLVKEMRLRKISTIEGANTFLESYVPLYNKRFSAAAAKDGDLHRPLSRGLDLDAILRVKTEHVLRNDFTVVHKKRLYQVLSRVRAKQVVVEERLDGRIEITYKGERLDYKEITKLPKIEKISLPPVFDPYTRRWYEKMVACSRLENYKRRKAEYVKSDWPDPLGGQGEEFPKSEYSEIPK